MVLVGRKKQYKNKVYNKFNKKTIKPLLTDLPNFSKIELQVIPNKENLKCDVKFI